VSCVQVEGPLGSVYRWQGADERATEWRCLCKTTAGRAPALIARLRALHS
jgi:periplasmic divalent cation tolerance protein